MRDLAGFGSFMNPKREETAVLIGGSFFRRPAKRIARYGKFASLFSGKILSDFGRLPVLIPET